MKNIISLQSGDNHSELIRKSVSRHVEIRLFPISSRRTQNQFRLRWSLAIVILASGLLDAQQPDSATKSHTPPITKSTQELPLLPKNNIDSSHQPIALQLLDSNGRQLINPMITDADLPSGAKDTTSLNFKDTDLRDLFRGLSVQHGINIYLDNAINKRITIALTNVKVYDAVKFLCDENNLALQLDGNILKVFPSPPPPKPAPPPPKVPIVSYDNLLLSVHLKDDDLEKVVLEIQKVSGHNILVMNGTTGAITGTLNKVEFDIGFIQLMNNNGFAVQKKNSIYVVSRLDYFVGNQGQNTQAAQNSGPYWVSVKDSLVTLDVTNAPLNRVLSDMVRQLNTDVVFYNTLTGNITAKATTITLPRALDLVLSNTNFTYKVSDGLYFVGEKTNKALNVTKLLRLKYLRAEKIFDLIPQSVTSQAVVKSVKEQNGFVIIGSNEVIGEMQEFLEQVDKPVAQVLIEALVVDYDLTHETDFGIEAGWLGKADSTGITRSGSLVPGIDLSANGTYLTNQLRAAGHVDLFGRDINLSNVVLPQDFYLKVKALEQKGLANIRSRPLIATLNGQQASLSIGTTQYFLLTTTTPYQNSNQVILQQSQNFQTIEADVKLEITPYVGADSLITVEIKPDFRTPVGQFNANVPPTINRRALSSTLVIKQGETIVLGGLIEDSEAEIRSQVPILGSIPLLGKLFSSSTKTNRKTELIIYVTPHISYGEAFQNVAVPQQEN